MLTPPSPCHLAPLIRLRHTALYKSVLIDWLINKTLVTLPLSFFSSITTDVIKERLWLVVEWRSMLIFIIVFHFIIRQLLTVCCLLVCSKTSIITQLQVKKEQVCAGAVSSKSTVQQFKVDFSNVQQFKVHFPNRYQVAGSDISIIQESQANTKVSARQPCWLKTDFDVKLALKVIHFANTYRQTRSSISPCNIDGFISDVSKEVATQIVKKVPSLTTRLSFDAPAQGNPHKYPHKPYISRN